MSPREVLVLFTGGWLGGLGLLTALNPEAPLAVRAIGVAEALAAALWFVPRTRLFGFGAMLAVLAVAVLHHLFARQTPGALVFYAAVVAYFAVEETRHAATPGPDEAPNGA